MNRRDFVATAAAAHTAASAESGKLAILGGAPVRQAAFPSWPVIGAAEEDGLLKVLRGRKWNRLNGNAVAAFEQEYAALLGARHVLATANGTSALFTALNAAGVQPGDEVIVPPYTFVATVNVVLLNYALPVFADTDIETFQVDPDKIASQITSRTSAIIPVHMAGGAANLDAILAAAKTRAIPVIEDACQAHLGEWRGRKLGTLGTAGCFSFQASKNLNSGEGGAVVTNDTGLYERAHSFHNNGRTFRSTGDGFSYHSGGANLRLTEFQGALLSAQMTRVQAQSEIRDENAKYLSSMIEKIPGIKPVKNYDGCTRSAWHLFMLRYDPAGFAGVPRGKFLEALSAEGIRASGGYTPLNKEPFLKNMLESKGYRRIYPDKLLREWAERNACPNNDRLCRQGVWLTQNTLLGSRSDMDQIAEAIAKVQRHAGDLRKV
jgi:dTDP-4-amino-4,6-dideoxygalactose transaminase